jgi:Kelch motif/Galactose oxidase, central domain
MALGRLLAAVTLMGVLAACTGPEPPPDGEHQGLRMTQPRAVHRATLLQDGRVLVTGGCTEPGCEGFDAGRRAEVYDGERGLVRDAEMATPRASGSATLLADGRVLLAGGYPGEGRPPTASAEVYDPVSDEFEPVGDLGTGRADHSATLMPDGRVLVAGGFDADGRALDSTEYYDPDTGAFSAGPPMLQPRAAHVAVLAGSELVLVGGTEESSAIAATEVLDASGAWSQGPALATPRVKMGAVPLGDGQVFVVGGATDTEGRSKLRSSELVDVSAGTSTPGPDLSEGEYKLDGAVATLPDGRIVVGGGTALEVYDAAVSSARLLDVPGYDARSFRTVTTVGPDTVLVLGGYDAHIEPTDAAYLVTIPG